MYSRIRRPTSAASTTTTTNSSTPLSPVTSSSSDGGMSPSSLTSGTSRTSRTSLTTWGEDTVVPSAGGSSEGKYVSPPGRMMDDDGEELLIDMSDEAILPPSFRTTLDDAGSNHDANEFRRREPSPAEKLKLLLRQMDAEIRETTPLSESTSSRRAGPTISNSRSSSGQNHRYDAQEVDVPSNPASGSRSAWRDGRRRVGNAGDTPSRRTSGSGSMSSVDLLDDHASSGRIPEVDEEESPPTPPRRFGNLSSSRTSRPQAWIPTRAAVLNASTSHPTLDPTHNTPPTALENFIAQSTSSPSRQSPPNHLETSRSSSSSSRKGKERAQSGHDAPHPSPRFARLGESAGSTPPKSSSGKGATRRPRTHTPKKWSVDLAPDPDEFAEHAEGLEIRGRELDLGSEDSGDPPWGVQQSNHAPPSRHDQSAGHDRTVRAARTPYFGIRDTENTPLPALPQPSDDDTEEEEFSPSSRREAMFRSPSKSSRSINRFAKLSQPVPVVASDPQQSPRPPTNSSPRPDMETSVSTPPRESLRSDLENISVFPTPHPPGRWSTPSKSGQVSTDIDNMGPVHRIKLSPASSKGSPRRSIAEIKEEDSEPGDTSFLTRLGLTSKRTTNSPDAIKSSSNIPLRPSRTLIEAQQALLRAASASSAARDRVEATQRQWLEALAAAQARWGDGAVVAVKRGWSWSNWAWWVGVEALLVWSVFRVTLDYASSTAFLSSLDPYSIHLPQNVALSIPLPATISAFLVPRTSANFFDLFENSDLWSRLESWGFEGVQGGVLGEGERMLGGVPT